MSAEAAQATAMAFKKALIERALGAELSHPTGLAGCVSTRAPQQADHRVGILAGDGQLTTN
jgi:hypothetical protein